jgi:hypothetical protein
MEGATMTGAIDRGAASPAALIASGPEGCILVGQGAVVTIRRAPVDGRHVADVHRALSTVRESGHEKAVMLSVFRLSPRFPVEVADTRRAGDYAATWRTLDRHVAAYAMVIEFGGVRGAGLRAITRALWAIARPQAQLGIFERLTDAAAWLAPFAAVTCPEADPATYVRLYREADAILERIDAVQESART